MMRRNRNHVLGIVAELKPGIDIVSANVQRPFRPMKFIVSPRTGKDRLWWKILLWIPIARLVVYRWRRQRDESILIVGIRIAGKEQFVGSVGIPSIVFGPQSMDTFLNLDVAPAGSQIDITVENRWHRSLPFYSCMMGEDPS